MRQTAAGCQVLHWQEVLLTRQEQNKAPVALDSTHGATEQRPREWDLSLPLSAACDLSHPERRSDKWLIPASLLARQPPTAMTTGGESPPATT